MRGEAVQGQQWAFADCVLCVRNSPRARAPFPKSTHCSFYCHNFSPLVFMRIFSKCQVRVIGSQILTHLCNCLVFARHYYTEEVERTEDLKLLPVTELRSAHLTWINAQYGF